MPEVGTLVTRRVSVASLRARKRPSALFALFGRRPASQLVTLHFYFFPPPYALSWLLFSAVRSRPHLARAPPSRRLCHPRLLCSSTREIAPSHNCSRECHAFFL